MRKPDHIWSPACNDQGDMPRKMLVPKAGLEPARPQRRGILNSVEIKLLQGVMPIFITATKHEQKVTV